MPLSWDRPLDRIALAAIGVVLLSSLVARLWALDRLPGVNGDETWLSTQVIELLAGNEAEFFTHTGNPVNPFHLLPMALVEIVLPTPGVLNVRLPAAASGLLLMLLAFPLTRKALGTPRALCFSLIVWVLPQHVGYARFCMDASQTPLASLLCLAAALYGRAGWLAIALVASVAVHPTNIFLVPVLAGVVAGQVWSGRFRFEARDWVWIACGVVIVGVYGLVRGSASPYTQDSVSLLVSPELALTQAVGVGRLISGVTIVQFMVGPLSATALRVSDLVFWAAVLFVFATGLPRLIRKRDATTLGLIAGLITSLAAVTVLVGGRPFTPGWDRYAMFLTVPACLMLACLIVPPMDGESSRAPAARLIAVALGALVWLGVFAMHYHLPLERHASRSHEAFSTGPVEPKVAAFADIAAEFPRGPVLILAEDWWTYSPMLYFAVREPQARVEWVTPRNLNASLKPEARVDGAIFAVGFEPGLNSADWVSFPKGRLAGVLERRLGAAGSIQPVYHNVYTDGSGDPILHLWRLR